MRCIPFELMEDILCCLPVKPLKRFRCVAKSWRSLIDSDRFVKSHLKRSLVTNSHRHFVVGSDKDVYIVDLDDGDRVKANPSVVKLPFSSSVLGVTNSCNGLVVVLVDKTLGMWNAFTREWKSLPGIGDDCTFRGGIYTQITYGFAWDPINDDYKLVRVVQQRDLFNRNLIASEAHIYGLKSNSWRQTVDFTYPILNWQVEVNGALHTLVFDLTPANQGPGGAKIMAFSVESERHYEVNLPTLGNIREHEVVTMSLNKLGVCLSMSYANESGIAVWVMKDYGVWDSWSKVLTIPQKTMAEHLDGAKMRPLVYSKDGHKVLLFYGHSTVIWMDLRNQSIDTVSVEGLPRIISYAEACVESLVSLRTEQANKQVHDQDEEKEKETRKKRDDFLSTGFKLVLR